MSKPVKCTFFLLIFLILPFSVSGMDTDKSTGSKMDEDKKAFFLALQTMSPDDAIYTFFVDRILTTKMWKTPFY